MGRPNKFLEAGLARILRRTYGRGFTITTGNFSGVKVYEETTMELDPTDDVQKVEDDLRRSVDDKLVEELEADFTIIRKPVDSGKG